MTKPRHREKKAMLEWYGGPFDPETMDLEAIEAGMSRIVQRRAKGLVGLAKSQGRRR